MISKVFMGERWFNINFLTTNRMNYLREFEILLKEKKPEILELLQPGKSVEAIQTALGAIGISNDDLISLYTWRDGTSKKDLSEKTIEELELYPSTIMLSLDDALSYFFLYAKERSRWSISYFPVFMDGGGDFLLLNIDSNDQRFGMLYLYSPSLLLSEQPMTIYDSMEYFFLTMNQCLMEGLYTSDDKKNLEVDYDIKYKVSAEINVKSDFWKS